MKKSFLLIILFIALIVLSSTLFFYLRSSSQELVLGIEKENQFNYYFNQDQELIFTDSENGIKNRRDIEITWSANYKYPYQSKTPIDIHVTEDDLVWRWTKMEDRITGKSDIEGSPVIIQYYIEDEILTGEITIENRTDKTIESLKYMLILDHPPSFKVINGKLTQSKSSNTPSLQISSDKNIGELVPNYEGKEKSSSKYVLSIGEVKPNENNTAIFHFSYKK